MRLRNRFLNPRLLNYLSVLGTYRYTRYIMRYRSTAEVTQAQVGFLILLLCTDILFIGIHCLHTYTSFFNNPVWSIEQDKGYSGYAEVFQYVKEYWIILMLLSLAIKTNLLYFAWCLPFGFLLLDDSFRLHEKLGRKLSNHFNFEPMLGLRSQDTGELMVYAFYALITCIPFIASLYSSDIRDKMLSYRLMVLLIVLAFFGVIVDMISIVTESHSLGMIEDGGEMIVVSIITWLIFRSAAEEIRINTRLEKYK